jgi:soluble lytic murein transglycosylase-like protein
MDSNSKPLFLQNFIPHSTDRDVFTDKVRQIATDLGTDPDWLMAVMYFESKFYHQAKNPFGSATGLIQFTASTARGLGATTKQLAAMTAVEQLDYVKKYLWPYRRNLTSLVNVYLSVFQPVAVNKPMDYRFKLSWKWVEANRIFDINKDGTIVKHEVATYLENYFKKFRL